MRSNRRRSCRSDVYLSDRRVRVRPTMNNSDNRPHGWWRVNEITSVRKSNERDRIRRQ